MDRQRSARSKRSVAVHLAAPVNISSIRMEFKRISDGAWLNCEISLKSSNGFPSLAIHPDEFQGDVRSLKPHDIRSRLRLQSEPLEYDLCSQLNVGDRLSATWNISDANGPYYDACLQKIRRVKHSLKVPCTCNFHIVWIDGGQEGKSQSVKACQIRKLSNNGIENVPILSDWLKYAERLHYSMVDDSDVDLLLDEEFGKITHIVDSDVDQLLDEELGKITHIVESIYTDKPLKEQSSESAIGIKKGRRFRLKKKSVNQKYEEGLNSLEHPDLGNVTQSPPFCVKSRLSPLAACAKLASMIQTTSVGDGFLPDETPSITSTKSNLFVQSSETVARKRKRECSASSNRSSSQKMFRKNKNHMSQNHLVECKPKSHEPSSDEENAGHCKTIKHKSLRGNRSSNCNMDEVCISEINEELGNQVETEHRNLSICRSKRVAPSSHVSAKKKLFDNDQGDEHLPPLISDKKNDEDDKNEKKKNCQTTSYPTVYTRSRRARDSRDVSFFLGGQLKMFSNNCIQ